MVFSSAVFLFLFLPVLLITYYNPIVKSRAFKNVVLLFGSIFFYAWGEPVFVFLMLFSVFVNYVSGILIDRTKDTKWSKVWLNLNLVWNIGLLFVFKYLSFLAENLGLLLHGDSAYYGIEIALPIGISFFILLFLLRHGDGRLYMHRCLPHAHMVWETLRPTVQVPPNAVGQYHSTGPPSGAG